MAKFKVCVEETYYCEFIVEAESFDEARSRVENACDMADIDMTEPRYFIDRICGESNEYGPTPLSGEEYEYERKYCECV